MAEGKGFGFISVVFGALGAETFLAIVSGAVFAGFIVCLFLSVFKSGYGLKKRLWFLIIIVICSALLKVRASVTGEKDFSPFLLFSGLAFFLPIYFIREKPTTIRKNNDHAREYVRLLEDKINRVAGYKNTPFVGEETQTGVKTEILKAEQVKPSGGDTPDFSHVKNVLQRLEPALLSCADRRQIHELELSLYEAENGGYSEEMRRKVNEGLGNLLKIMARHGV